MTVAPVLPRAAAATILGGVAWAALAVPAQLEYADIISYDSYNRLLALPIALVLFGLVGLYLRLWARSNLARAAVATLVLGFLLLLIGNVVEFWGALIFDEETAEAARDAGSGEHWIGSDIGWIVFGVGMLLSISAAVAVALSVRSLALPRAVKLFIG